MAAEPRAVTVLVVDDNPAVRAGLVSLLEGADGIVVAGVAADGEQAVRQVELVRPDVTLLDVRMPVMDGLVAAPRIADRTRVIMLTSDGDVPTVQRALSAGVAGYLVHGAFRPEELAAMVLEVAAGGAHLSPRAAAVALAEVAGPSARQRVLRRRHGISSREEEILDLMAAGASNTDIAVRLFLSPKTVKNHINRIFAKINARDRGQAIAMWLGTVLPPGR